MITVVCWKWKQAGSQRSAFDAVHVNTLRNMVDRHYSGDWQMVCFTDDPGGIDPRIVCVPLPDFHSDIQNPLGANYPSCYRRLALFGPNASRFVGDRFVSIDLDCVIVDDLSPLWDRDEDIVFWESPIKRPDYNGSMWLARKGAHPELFDEFHPNITPALTSKKGFLGSDQGWFSYRLPGKPVWTSAGDGVYSWNTQLRNRRFLLPPNARIVFFPGATNPWHKSAQERAGWVREHYR